MFGLLAKLAWFVPWTLLKVAVRRVLFGRRRATWSYLLEVTVEIMRIEARRAGDDPIAERKRLGQAPVPLLLRRRLSVDRLELGGVAAERSTPRGWDGERTLLYLHGGGYGVGSPGTHRDLVSRLSVACRARVYSLDYRLAPEHPYPAGLEDALSAYRALLEDGVAPAQLFVGGDSAGGGLAMSLLLRLRDAEDAMPAGALLLSPWVDLADDGKSDNGLHHWDFVHPEVLDKFAQHYLADTPATEAIASSAHGDLSGLPPLLVHAGGVETLRPQVERIVRRARAAGVDATLKVWGGMIHVFQAFHVLPESAAAIRDIVTFVEDRAGSVSAP